MKTAYPKPRPEPGYGLNKVAQSKALHDCFFSATSLAEISFSCVRLDVMS